MKIIGLTGGIGSGKSTVAFIFSLLDIPCYSSDDAAKYLMNNKPSIIRKIKNLFGEESYIKEELNRKYIANIVFHDNDKLIQLNGIVHPEVGLHFNEWLQFQTSQFVLKESALLFDTLNNQKVDKIISVIAPTEIRIQRVMSRQNISKEEVIKRIEAQHNNDFLIKHSDFLIHNYPPHFLISQVFDIYKQINAE
jgi:dephospho-CoA kinase